MQSIKTFFASFFLAAIHCFAAAINISGIVTDTGGTPLSGAIITLEKSGQSKTSLSDGRFVFGDMASVFDRNSEKPVIHRPFCIVQNRTLTLNIQAKSDVDIAISNIQGQKLYAVCKSLEIGTHTILLPDQVSGICLYRIQSRNIGIVFKNVSFDCLLHKNIQSMKEISRNNTLTKQAQATTAINEVIAVTKQGYLNYRTVLSTSDTSGIEIKMVFREGTVTDADGNIYQTVRIGKQIWTVENLRTTKYNDGSSITLETSELNWPNGSTGKYCFYNNTTNADSIKKFGALYNFYAVATNKLAISGWHVPTDQEWSILESYLDANGYNWDGSTWGQKVAKSMAAKVDWTPSIIDGAIGNDLAQNNRSGFCAYAAGSRGSLASVGGSFFDKGKFASFWTSTSDLSSWSWYHYITYDLDLSYRQLNYRSTGYSIRLVKN